MLRLFPISIIVCLAQTSFLFAQFDSKFGKVELEELKMAKYDKDTSASAVILFDLGQLYFTYVNNGFKLIYEKQVRIKILKKAGYNWANIDILLLSSNDMKEELKKVKGFTYNLENNKVVREKFGDKIYTENRNDNLTIKKFTLPNVKEGSIIEYSYSISSDFFFYLHPWYFQATIPIAYSKYVTEIPEYFRYKPLMQGIETVKVLRENTNVSFSIMSDAGSGPKFQNIGALAEKKTYEAQDIPAFKNERYLRSAEDYITKIEFELGIVKFPYSYVNYIGNSWDRINEELLQSESFGQQLNRSDFLKDIAMSIKSANRSPISMAVAAFNHIKSTMRWDGLNSIYPYSTLKNAYNIRKGNSADINLTLVTLLRELGLDANPVVLSTQDNGRIKTGTPMITKLNYVIAHVLIENETILLDATDILNPGTFLPERCVNGKGGLISARQFDWVSLKSSTTNTQLFLGKLKITPHGTIEGSATISFGGYYGVDQREIILSNGKEKHIENLKKKFGNWEFDDVIIHNVDSLYNDVKYEFSNIKIASNSNASIIHLDPMLGQGERENPYRIDERKYPVNFTTGSENVYTCSFTVPAGYKVEEMPKSIIADLPDKGGKFSYSISQTGDIINVSSRLEITKNIFSPEEYRFLKEFYSIIVNKHSEQIVLKKE